MTWTNPIPDTLWFATSPLPAFITADGPNFTLRMGGQTFQGATLAQAQAEYETIAIAQLVPLVPLVPNLPAFSLPTDGQIIAAKRISTGKFVIGVWTAGSQTVEVSAVSVPVADLAAWSPLP